MHAVIVRNAGSDNSSLMTLSSVLASCPSAVDLIYVDGSTNGITERVNDLLSMFIRKCGRVHVVRTPLARHSEMLAIGLETVLALAPSRGFNRLHHFDDDVVVSKEWWEQSFGDGWESCVLCESDDRKGFSHTESGECLWVSCVGMTAPINLVNRELINRLKSHSIGIFEDVLTCKLSKKPSKVHNRIGLYHASRDTGGNYVSSVLDHVWSSL